MSRRTEQRETIEHVMKHAPRPLSAQEVLDRAQDEVPNMGITTVYRHLKALVARGFLVTVDLPNEPSRYERAALDHHHHFQCTQCMRVFDVPGCAKGVHALAPEGFEVHHHEVLLFGACPDCPAEAKTPD